MKILHSADWHLDAPLTGKNEEQARFLRAALLKIPQQIVDTAKAEGCDLILLAGDLFDGAHTRESLKALMDALAKAEMPVFITPGNHDFCQPNSPYITENWPENVYIFKKPVMESVHLPQLDCTVYGAGYEAMDCPGLLKDFSITDAPGLHIGILHSEPQQPTSPYAPMTAVQVRQSGLDYLALGHIHKSGSFRSGNTICAWPGCPMGKGYDETGEKGVLLVELGEVVSVQFRALDTPRFYDETVEAGIDPIGAAGNLLPPLATTDCYRITFIGYSNPIDLSEIATAFSHIPYLELRDRTLPETDLWSDLGEDTLEGLYFKLLHDGIEDTDSPTLKQQLLLAAKLSRRILDGQEVVLP